MSLWWRFLSLFGFGRNTKVRIGIYGPPNGGKTTLANRICKDWIGEEMGRASKVAHETRSLQEKELITIRRDGRTIAFSLVDTPGIASRIDYEEFIRAGIKDQEAKSRAKEATKGVVESIKRLDDMDCILVVLDATKDPYTQVNVTLLGNLDARKTPLLLLANKIDLKKADSQHIRAAFPQYEVVGVSAKTGEGMDAFYEQLFALRKKVRRPKGPRV